MKTEVFHLVLEYIASMEYLKHQRGVFIKHAVTSHVCCSSQAQ